jgi:hypothetical protein
MRHDKLTAVLERPGISRDVLLELYDAWAVARDEARFAYVDWCAAPHSDKAAAYAVFLAGSDREDAAGGTFLHALGIAAQEARDGAEGLTSVCLRLPSDQARLRNELPLDSDAIVAQDEAS